MFVIFNYIKYMSYYIISFWGLGIGDWGLGIGDWAQSPIPNPQSQSQSPIPNPQNKLHYEINFILFIYYL